jgi:hypothetical protein
MIENKNICTCIDIYLYIIFRNKSIDDCFKDVKICQKCQKTLNYPIRLGCLHYYCKKCLTDLKKVPNKKIIGWKCLACDIFTSEQDIKDRNLQILILMEKYKKMPVKMCGKCDNAKRKKKKIETDLKFCTNCTMFLCEQCSNKHEHGEDEIDNAPIDIIDKYFYFYCDKIHKDPTRKGKSLKRVKETYCMTCKDLVCDICHVDFKEHNLQSTETALKECNEEMDQYKRAIISKLRITNKGIQYVDQEIKMVEETFEKWMKHSKQQIKKFIDLLTKTWEKVAAGVNEEKHNNVKRLTEIKNKILQKEQRCKSFFNLSEVILAKSASQSQLLELQSGILVQGKKLSREEIQVERFQITTHIYTIMIIQKRA